MLAISVGIHKKPVRITNREDPSQAAYSGSALFVLAFFGRKLLFEILEYLS